MGEISLDHVGIIVPDLDEAGALFEALGFTLTQRADHMRPAPDGTLEPAGSAQRSIMFERGYIEVQEITDPLDRHLLSPARAKHYGLHILAFGTTDIEAAHEAVAANGLPVGPVLHWTRAIDEPDLDGDAEFAFFVADYVVRDEALYCWVEHRTPHLLRSPRLVGHPNGARGITMVSIEASDETMRETIVQRLLGSGGMFAGEAESRGSTVVFAKGGRFEIRPSGQEHGARFAPPGAAWPRCVMLELQVATIEAIGESAGALRLPSRRSEGVLTIDLMDRIGLGLRFRAEPI